MFSLTIREQFLVTGILCALATGAAVKHWRDSRRIAGTSPAAPTVSVAGGHARTP